MYVKKSNHKKPKTFTQMLTLALFIQFWIFVLAKLVICLIAQKINFDFNFMREFDLSNISTIDRLCNFLIVIIIPLQILILVIKRLIESIFHQRNKIYQQEAIYNVDFTECLEIGYFTNDDGEVQIKPFLETTSKVPRVLPHFITNLSNAFQLNQNKKIEGIEDWNTSNVTNMCFMFAGAKKFSQNLSKWNVKKVIDFTDFAENLPNHYRPKFRQKK
ncbi:BspA family leucine-rich repeat surface protein [Mycoplasma putrefaciens]|uniref:Transmembrane protein n=1 Tax=Mycoplasma putrefaciens Mput9231 TaxID=1292033 RepID=M9WC20_9MOLU|nr:BspA family leucine-rich repeat surface protein [Mycoplasma putrefaciens]AGJ90707.1 Hypothetical protein, predicted transmembrane protein, DUF285 family [Mycoplasma putrefaciens Mput9231]